MTALISCCNLAFLDKAIKSLSSSYFCNPSISHILYFIGDKIDVEIPNFINIKYVRNDIQNLQNPYLFAYKYWCLLQEIYNYDVILYTDSTHFFQKQFNELDRFFYKDCFILPYDKNQFLIKHWTTKKCIKELNGDPYIDIPQVWAGFQGYKSTENNFEFLKEMLSLCLNEELSSPYPWIQNPDGKNSECLYHRNDQSILSIQLLKNNLYPQFSIQKDYEFGDYISVRAFYPDQYNGDVLNSIYRCLYPRYFK